MTKILLVEDDKSLREIYGVRLLAEGYDIVSAGDGEEALATAIKEKPDLIVSDVMMPKISGFDMLDILRSTPETKDIKVIMMTALSSEDQRERGEKLGADRYLVKSQVGIEDVVRTVHEVLGDAPVTAPQFSGMQQPQPQPQQQVQQAPEQSEPEPEQLPQPTAPFSSPRPATLGERIIHPIESEEPQAGGNNELSLADRISAELEQANQAAQPQQPQQQPEPAQQAPEQPQIQQMQQQAQEMAQPAQQQPETQPEQFIEQPQQQAQPQPEHQMPEQQPQAPQQQFVQPQQQPEMQMQQPQMQQPQPQMPQQMPEQQMQQPQAPTQQPQDNQIDPNSQGQSPSLNVPPRQ